jgi:hypothetical protein
VKRPALHDETDDDGRRARAPHVAPTHPRTPAWLSWALIAVAGLVFLTWLFLAVAHVDDRYQLDHVSGARMALARYFNDGTLYPELYDGQFYAGTRFMPIPIVLHALVARVTGEYLVSGKLVSYVTMLALVATIFVLLRRLRCPLAFSVAVPALVLTSQTGLAGGMDARGDALPLLLQVVAVGIVASTARPGPTVAAGALAAVALLSKLSAVWAPLAIVIWLLSRDRRRLALFSAAYVGTAGGLLLLFATLTEGRIIDNVFGLSTAGITGLRSLLVAPYRFAHLMVDVAITAWAVVPLVALAAWIKVKRGRDSIYLVALVCALAVLLVVLTDVGTGWNQLIDVVVLIALVLGALAARAHDSSTSLDRESARTVEMIAAFALLWVIGSGLAVTLAPPVQETLRGEVSYDSEPLSALEVSPTSVLSEDPYVPLSLEQAPVVLDPFMLPRLADKAPDAIPDLVRRIEAQEFDVVVLVVPLEPVDRSWWAEQSLGLDVARAISRAYTYAGRMQGYYLYAPHEAGSQV